MDDERARGSSRFGLCQEGEVAVGYDTDQSRYRESRWFCHCPLVICCEFYATSSKRKVSKQMTLALSRSPRHRYGDSEAVLVNHSDGPE